MQNSLLPRAQRGIEVSCERVRVNRVVGRGDVVKPPTCVKRRRAKRADAEGGENGGKAIIACTCLPTTFICGWHIYMYYVLCRPYLGLQPLQSALLFWRVAAALSCGPTTIPLLRLCVCMSVGGCPSPRGTQALWCRAECEKSLTTCVSLWQDLVYTGNGTGTYCTVQYDLSRFL